MLNININEKQLTENKYIKLYTFQEELCGLSVDCHIELDSIYKKL